MLGRESILWGRPSDPGDAPRRSILHCVRMLAPFQEALPESPYLASDVAEGERQFYAFLHGLYAEMYGDPGFFLVPETEYDAYMASPARKQWEEKHAQPVPGERVPVDQKESRLRNQFQQAIRFYAAYLYEVGMRGRFSQEGVLELPLSAWREARAAMEWPHLREGNEERFQRLRALGLGVTQGKGSVRVLNRDFPKMMFGLWALCAAPKTAYHRTNYLRLDYAGALRGQPRPGGRLPGAEPRAGPAGKAAAQGCGAGRLSGEDPSPAGDHLGEFLEGGVLPGGKGGRRPLRRAGGAQLWAALGGPPAGPGVLGAGREGGPRPGGVAAGPPAGAVGAKARRPGAVGPGRGAQPPGTDALAALLGLVRECYFKAEEK